MSEYRISPGVFSELLNAAQRLRDTGAVSRDTVEGAALIGALCCATDAVQEATDCAAEVETARSTYACDDVEIDDCPLVSPAEGGVWVAAWVWVANEEEDAL